MVEIKPGPELDKAVAEAVDPYCSVGMCASSGCIDIPVSATGDTAETDPDVLAVWKWDGERNWRTLPKFSTDLNAAFAAAEKVFDCGFAVHTAGKPVGGWKRFQCIVGVGWDGERAESQIQVEAETPALAVCAAILKLKDKDG